MARYALSILLCVWLGAGAALAQQTTAFTYQGQLTDAGQPADGNWDLRFALFGGASGGTQIGTMQTVSTVPVSGGVFTVQLDFGGSAFPGANRFLEIGVRPAGGGSYTTLAPRQQISSTPYAIRTLSAATADTLSSACVGCVTDGQIQSVSGSKVSGSVPAASLPIGSGNYVQNTTAVQANANFNISGNGVLGGNLFLSLGNVSIGTSALNARLSVAGNTVITGNVGIGTTTPAQTLEVNGVTSLGAPGGVYGYLVDGGSPGPYPTLAFNSYGTSYKAGVAGYGGVLQFQDGNGSLIYYTSSNVAAGAAHTSTARLAISATGAVGIGTTAPLAALDDRGNLLVAGTVGIGTTAPFVNTKLDIVGGLLRLDQLAGGGDEALCRNSAVHTLATCSSSRRYKEHIAPYGAGLELIRRLRPISFAWKATGRRDLGLGAEEVARIEPLLVTHNDDGEVEGVKYDHLNVILINAIKQQQNQIEALQVANAALNARLRAVERGVGRQQRLNHSARRSD